MKNEFGKNYEYIDDYIQSSLKSGRALIYQLLVDVKKALIEKDKELSKLRNTNTSLRTRLKRRQLLVKL
jgi:hypothetical protein